MSSTPVAIEIVTIVDGLNFRYHCMLPIIESFVGCSLTLKCLAAGGLLRVTLLKKLTGLIRGEVVRAVTGGAGFAHGGCGCLLPPVAARFIQGSAVLMHFHVD